MEQKFLELLPLHVIIKTSVSQSGHFEGLMLRGASSRAIKGYKKLYRAPAFKKRLGITDIDNNQLYNIFPLFFFS